MPSDRALLVAFGALRYGSTNLSADSIYKTLMSKNQWLTAHVPRDLASGTPVIFYQSGVGFRGTAITESIERTVSTDSKWVGGIPIEMYPHKILLREHKEFTAPIDPRPCIEQLTFISNKIYWGHAFRFSPRFIPLHDFTIIINKSTKANR